jgi:hypothetical protein
VVACHFAHLPDSFDTAAARLPQNNLVA